MEIGAVETLGPARKGRQWGCIVNILLLRRSLRRDATRGFANLADALDCTLHPDRWLGRSEGPSA